MRKLLLSVITFIFPLFVMAFEVEIDNFIYYSEGSDVSVYGIKDKCVGGIEIPSKISFEGVDYYVTKIGAYAFFNFPDLTSISIPNSVKSIGEGAFSGCTSLSSIKFPESIDSIGDGAFWNCSGLSSVVIPGGVTYIGSGVFSGCINLISMSVDVSNTNYDSREDCNAIIKTSNNILISGCQNTVIPESVSSIGSDAFSYHSNIKSLTIPNSVTTIGDYAFRGCTLLSSIIFPENVETIGMWAFNGCTSLTSIFIPKNVTSIGRGAFTECSSVKEIKVASGNTIYDSRNNCNAIIETSNNALIFACENTIIPGNINIIDKDAFRGCTGLTSVTIPVGVYSIDYEIFRDCKNLSSISVASDNPVYDSRNNCNAIIDTYNNKLIRGCKNTIIPEGVVTIGFWAFYGCSDLTSIFIPKSVHIIENQAFHGCGNITSIEVASDNYFFDSRNNCNAIINTYQNQLILGCKNTIIPYGVNIIASNAFNSCNGLKSITIPQSVARVRNNAFYECKDLVSVTINSNSFFSNTSTYSSRASNIFGDQVEIYNIGAGVESIGAYFFEDCINLRTVNMQEGLVTIDYGAFIRCSSLTSLNLPKSVVSIGRDAFNGCKGLSSIIIPEGVTKINSYTFSDCTGLNSVTLPNSLDTIGFGAFRNCAGLTSIYIPENVKCIDGNAFLGCSGISSITIPKNVAYIGGSAFGQCTSLMLITINSNTFLNNSYLRSFSQIFGDQVKICNIGSEVKSIGDGFFSGYKGLMSVNISASVTKIGYQAFSNCTGLTSITIPESMDSIAEEAFYGCVGLTSINIPKNVKSIGEWAFYRCTSLTSMVVASENSFFDSRENCNAIIETNSNTLISGCKNSIIPSGIIKIGDYAFSGCSDLTSITIPESVDSIGAWAFSSCANLTSITIQEGLTFIGYGAFSRCNSLTSITLPESTNYIEIGAFGSCTSLMEITCKAKNPPFISYIPTYDYYTPYEVFYGISTNCKLFIPAGTIDKYTDSLWRYLLLIEEGIDDEVISIFSDNISIQNSNGMIYVMGVTDDTPVHIYNSNGIKEGSAISKNNQAIINTNLKPGSVAVVKIGTESITVVMK